MGRPREDNCHYRICDTNHRVPTETLYGDGQPAQEVLIVTYRPHTASTTVALKEVSMGMGTSPEQSIQRHQGGAN